MMEIMSSIERRMAAAWHNKYVIRRAISTQILMSPQSLVSLDLPEIWTAAADNLRPPTSLNCSNEQDAVVIDGKLIAEDIRSTIATEVRRMKESIGKVPGLAVILVGQRRDSQTYVRNKIKACEEAGIKSLFHELPEDCPEDAVLSVVSSFNEDPTIHGILVQLPLPQHLDEVKILNALSLEKDVDGFHPMNMGNLAMRGREPLFIPCTPKGCIELLFRFGVEIMGKNAVVIGRSNVVGLPTSLLLQRYHATVSVVHALTNNPEEITSEADIVVTAAGVPNLVRSNWLKPGAVVIDVGTCPIEVNRFGRLQTHSEFQYQATDVSPAINCATNAMQSTLSDAQANWKREIIKENLHHAVVALESINCYKWCSRIHCNSKKNGLC
ncbi:bifunctional protein FolD 1, mitochondrial isoform X2 [Hevea brasiliensis]|nr:bifunctional protein FolD 1, mitochondrial isoform X2 [Hevea brasiliensis]